MRSFRSRLFVVLLSIRFFACTPPNPGDVHPVDLSSIQKERLPYRFEKSDVVVAPGVSFHDLDGDGIDEILIFQSGSGDPGESGFVIIDAIEMNKVKHQFNYEGSINLSNLLTDINRDGKKEIIVSEKRSDEIVVEFIQMDGQRLLRLKAVEKPARIAGTWNCILSAREILDLDGDGNPEILFLVQTGIGYQPRGVLVLDPVKKEFRTLYTAGIYPISLKLSDTDGDGKEEILLGSSATANVLDHRDADSGLTDDTRSYLIVLDRRGKVLEQKETGKEHSTTLLFTHDITGDGKKEVVVHFSSTHHQKEESYIGIYNPETGVIGILKKRAMDICDDILFVDHNRDRVDDILIGWKDGTIEILDSGSRVLASFRFPEFHIDQLKKTDFNNDGGEEFFISGKYKGTYVNLMTDHQFRPLAYDDSDLTSPLFIRHGFGERVSLFMGSRIHDQQMFQVGIIPQTLPYRFFRLVSWEWLFAGLLLGMLSLAAVCQKRIRDRIRKIQREPSIPGCSAAWAVMAQKLAHEIKSPLSTIMLSAQRLEMEYRDHPQEAGRYARYSGRILDQVLRLQKMTDAFLKFSRIESPRLEKTGLARFIDSWISGNKLRFGSGVKVETLMDHQLPEIRIDTEQMKIVFQNLIDNSVKAMEGKGVITIATRMVESLQEGGRQAAPAFIELEISDTGKGIEREDMEKLFQPFFSKTAGGTGLGLVIVKRIIDDHEGTIAIESEPGIGTTVKIRLPAG